MVSSCDNFLLKIWYHSLGSRQDVGEGDLDGEVDVSRLVDMVSRLISHGWRARPADHMEPGHCVCTSERAQQTDGAGTGIGLGDGVGRTEGNAGQGMDYVLIRLGVGCC